MKSNAKGRGSKAGKRHRGKARKPQTPVEMGIASPLVYTLRELAMAARISRSKIYELIKLGKGPKFMSGHRKRVSREDAEAWIADQAA